MPKSRGLVRSTAIRPFSTALPSRLALRIESKSSGKSVTSSTWRRGASLMKIHHHPARLDVDVDQELRDRRDQQLAVRTRDREDVVSAVPEGRGHASALTALL